MYSQEIKNKVAKSRDWKLSNIECARRIGISLDEYLNIKKHLGFKSKKLKHTNDITTNSLNFESYDLDNGTGDRKSTRLNSSHSQQSRMPSSA